MSAPTTFGVSTDEHTKQLVYTNAAKQGLSVSAYVLSWLPEAAADTSARGTDANGNRARKRRTVSEASSA